LSSVGEFVGDKFFSGFTNGKYDISPTKKLYEITLVIFLSVDISYSEFDK